MVPEPRRRGHTLARVLLLALPSLVHGHGHAHAQAEQDIARTTVYVRVDGDDTTIVTPSLHVGAQVAEATRVDLVYTVDIWTSASVDIVTAATTPVTEQRDELDVSGSHDLGDLTLGLGYRYSIENDYESHGGSLGASIDFAQKSATLALVTRALFDDVWAVGGDDLKQQASTLSARLSFTQVVDRDTLGQLAYEIARQAGYLASPYRYVRIADDLGVVPGTCVAPVSMCLPERNPDDRLRHALALKLRRALGGELSLGGGYRYYFDDWKLTSHTADLDLTWSPADDLLLGLVYRFYAQSKAEHYRPFYAMLTLPEHYASDKELSALSSHRIGAQADKAFALDDAGSTLRGVLIAGPTIYQYSDFPLLESVTAVEVTLSLGVEL